MLGLLLLMALPGHVPASLAADSAPAAAADSALPKSAVSPDYIIGPGDTLSVFVWRNADLSAQVPVRPDGKISTPLVEDMVAVGKTTSQLARDIEDTLEKYVRSPSVNVIVVNAVSAMSQVTVVGAATNPKSIPYRDGLKVLDAVLAVGGLTQFAAGNRAKIERDEGGGKKQEIKVKLKRLLEDGDLSQNLPLKPGDVLVIPESFL
ncbi:MAG TPA: XrtA/PEP-CTERM system exopolysaccharide export protein [Steroidobacteraceae bacterium]|nr:XrtA/PEP-CTERM system exopolysaccharide export protein [Steroidobacteraceae bacterium]